MAEYLGCTNLRRIGGVHDRLGTRLVPCRKCFNCSRNRARDWVGRIIAESRVAQRTLFATFTVGNSASYSYPELEMDRRATSLNREDCEAYVDRERKYLRPGRMRMFYVGEYGSEKGRAHYHFVQFFYGCDGPEHIILDWRYFRGKYPDGFVREGMTHVKSENTYWPWGYVFYREFHPRDAHYCAKYSTKGTGVEWQEMRPGISTGPLLGAGWFSQLAHRYVEDGLSPQSRKYQFPPLEAERDAYQGPQATYWMNDATARWVCREFVRRWRAVHGNNDWPQSEMVDGFLDFAAKERAHKACEPSVRDALAIEDWERGVVLRRIEQRKRDFVLGAYNPIGVLRRK